MMRLVVSVLAVAVAWTALAPGSEPSPLPTPTSDGGACKPQAPLEVVLTQASAQGDRVTLDLELEPQRDLRDLTWRLQLPADVVLMDGRLEDTAPGARGVRSSSRLELAIPADGRHHQVTVEASAVMLGSDETGRTFDEPVAVSTTLHWGEIPAVGPRTLQRDPDGSTYSGVTVAARPAEGR